MSPALPRGRCPVCRAEVAVRKGSLVREHKDQRDALYATGRNDEVPTCEGSGERALVDKELTHHLSKAEADTARAREAADPRNPAGAVFSVERTGATWTVVMRHERWEGTSA